MEVHSMGNFVEILKSIVVEYGPLALVVGNWVFTCVKLAKENKVIKKNQLLLGDVTETINAVKSDYSAAEIKQLKEQLSKAAQEVQVLKNAVKNINRDDAATKQAIQELKTYLKKKWGE